MDIISGRVAKAVKVVIYGPEGIGKSTLASRFPEPLFIDTEDSTAHMDVRRFQKPDNWLELLQQVDWVLAHPDICRTLILDTADWAETLCIEHVCARDKKAGIEDYGYGRGYTFAVEEFGRLLNKLEQIKDKGVHVVVVAHALIAKFDQPDELGSYNRWTLKLIDTPKCSNSAMLREWADAVLFVNYKTIVINVDGQGAAKGKNKAQGGARVIYTTHHPCWDAKNRFGLPDELPLDYEQIRGVIESGAPSAPMRPSPVAPVAAPAAPAAPVDKSPAPPPEPPRAPQEPPKAPERRWPELPLSLERMMVEAQVEPEEVRGVIAARGIYPADTPWSVLLENTQFMNGWLMHPDVWPKVVDAAKQRRMEAPF